LFSKSNNRIFKYINLFIFYLNYILNFKNMKLFILSIILICFNISSNAQSKDPSKYILENEKNIGKEEPGPHKGNGSSVGHSFFTEAKDYRTAFRKRVLKPGASIGYHLQKEDEIYYVVSGKGLMRVNEDSFEVNPGDGILTRPGSSHGIENIGKENLEIIIVYEKHK
jgi:mannose-6-phosphate isomerase-like protein (cupin superfamily)